MSDLERAKSALASDSSITLAMCKDGVVFTDTLKGVAPLVAAAESGADYSGYCAADRIVGKAAAMLYALLKVKEVYAEVLSKRGAETLSRFGIAYSYSVMTEFIVNRRGDGECPMEEAVKDAPEPSEALEKIKNKIALMKKEAAK